MCAFCTHYIVCFKDFVVILLPTLHPSHAHVALTPPRSHPSCTHFALIPHPATPSLHSFRTHPHPAAAPIPHLPLQATPPLPHGPAPTGGSLSQGTWGVQGLGAGRRALAPPVDLRRVTEDQAAGLTSPLRWEWSGEQSSALLGPQSVAHLSGKPFLGEPTGKPPIREPTGKPHLGEWRLRGRAPQRYSLRWGRVSPGGRGWGRGKAERARRSCKRTRRCWRCEGGLITYVICYHCLLDVLKSFSALWLSTPQLNWLFSLLILPVIFLCLSASLCRSQPEQCTSIGTGATESPAAAAVTKAAANHYLSST